ncbi:MAG: 4'-phosphopantetheinyl transferase superfamily protein [Amphritea sp.]|nr:4'-phosphopantetheinyl transferase superfamily protein [Amphritea sp.]
MPVKSEQPSVRFWYTHAGSIDAQTCQQWLLLLPLAQQNYYQTIKHNSRRKSYLFSRLLICSALSQLFNKPLNHWQIEELDNSAPIIRNLQKNYFISLTHSNDLICFALSTDRIGIDVEAIKIERDCHAAAELFMNTEELSHLPDSGDTLYQYFYRLWCAKEALYKALPAPDQKKVTLASLFYADLEANRTAWRLLETEIENYRVAIVTQEPLSISELPLIEINVP